MSPQIVSELKYILCIFLVFCVWYAIFLSVWGEVNMEYVGVPTVVPVMVDKATMTILYTTCDSIVWSECVSPAGALQVEPSDISVPAEDILTELESEKRHVMSKREFAAMIVVVAILGDPLAATIVSIGVKVVLSPIALVFVVCEYYFYS